MLDLQQIKLSVARDRVRAIPPLAAFAESVVAASADGDSDEFWRCEAPFAALLASSFVPDLLAWELHRLRTDADYLPSGNGESNLEAFEMGLLTLNLHLFQPSAQASLPHLLGFCEHKLIANLGPSVLRLEQWRQHETGPRDVLDRSRPLEPLPVRIVEAGAWMRFEAHRDVARWGAVDRPAAILSLTRNRVTRLRWIYDAATLSPLRLEGGDSGAARMEYACALLVALQHTDAAPVIASLYDHPDHFVRWSAVRRTMDLDPALGRQVLERATSDVHPHVQRAASRSIERLDARAARRAQEK